MRWDAHRAAEPAIAEALHMFTEQGIFAASKALGRSTRTLNRIALERGIEFSTNTAKTMEARRRARASLVARVKEMAGKHTQAEMCTALGITRAVLRDLAEEHYINIDSRSRGA